jgi:hypothetical protein
MKWVKLKKDLDNDHVKDKERKALFNVYENEEELQKDLKNPEKFIGWVTYSFQDFELDKKAQRKYEIFCGGFLYYHDDKFKRYWDGAGYVYPEKPGINIAPTWKKYPDNTFGHEIYFEWNTPKGYNATSVKIYINPTPEPYNSSPPVPPPPPPPESNP